MTAKLNFILIHLGYWQFVSLKTFIIHFLLIINILWALMILSCDGQEAHESTFSKEKKDLWE